jgi:hypothetical protein
MFGFHHRHRGAPYIPGFSQGELPPEELKSHFYGTRSGRSTSLHRTGTIDIQVNRDTGEVVAVWFRCLSLPFAVSKVGGTKPDNPGNTVIQGIEYVVLPEEASDANMGT